MFSACFSTAVSQFLPGSLQDIVARLNINILAELNMNILARLKIFCTNILVHDEFSTRLTGTDCLLYPQTTSYTCVHTKLIWNVEISHEPYMNLFNLMEKM